MASCSVTEGMLVGPDVFVFGRQHSVRPREHDLYKGFAWSRKSYQVIDQHREAESSYGRVIVPVDIHTPFDTLRAENIVTHVGLGEVQQPHGSSCGWRAEITDVQVFQRTTPAGPRQTIRVRIWLHTYGNAQTRILRVHVFGVAVRGTADRSLPGLTIRDVPGSESAASAAPLLGSITAGNTLIFSRQQPTSTGSPFVVGTGLGGLGCDQAVGHVGFGDVRCVLRRTPHFDARLTRQEDSANGPTFHYECQAPPLGRKDGEVFRLHLLGVASTRGRAIQQPSNPRLVPATAPLSPSTAIDIAGRYLIFSHVVAGNFVTRQATFYRTVEIEAPSANSGDQAVVHLNFGDFASPAPVAQKHWDAEVMGVDSSQPGKVRVHYRVRTVHGATVFRRLHFFGVIRYGNRSLPLGLDAPV